MWTSISNFNVLYLDYNKSLKHTTNLRFKYVTTSLIIEYLQVVPRMLHRQE